MRKLAILILLLAVICAFGQLDSLNMRLERVLNACSYPLYQVNDSIYISRSSTVTFDTIFHSKESITSTTSTLASVYNDSIVIYRRPDSLDNNTLTFINVSNGTYEDTLNQLYVENDIFFCDSLIFWENDTVYYVNLNELPRIEVRDTLLTSSQLFRALQNYECFVNDTIRLKTGFYLSKAYNVKDIFYPEFLSSFPNFIEYGYGYWSDEKAFVSDSVIFCGGSDYINKFIISFDTGEIRPYDVGEEYYDGGNLTCGALRCWYDDSIVVSIPYRLDADGDYYSNRISLLNIKDPFDVKTVASYTVDIEGDVYYSDCLAMPDDSLILFIVVVDIGTRFVTNYCFLRLCSTEGVNENQGKGPESYDIHTFPNPFNSTISISGAVEACYAVYDIYGNMVSNFANDYTQSAVWQPSQEVVSGVYIIKATTRDGATSTKPAIYVK